MGFPDEEFEARLRRVQALMVEHGLAALLLTTEPDFRYFSGFLTRLWESPTRPWFLIIPAMGKPIAVIPSIGVNLMRKTFVDDIRTWPAPRPQDDGVSLLAKTLLEFDRWQWPNWRADGARNSPAHATRRLCEPPRSRKGASLCRCDNVGPGLPAGQIRGRDRIDREDLCRRRGCVRRGQ